MNITENAVGDVSQIHLDGRFDADTCGVVEDFIRAKIANEGTHRFVLNMEKVPFIASAGLRVVLVFAKELRQSQGDLCLAALQPNVHRVFEISGLNNVLHIFDDMEAATQSFQDA